MIIHIALFKWKAEIEDAEIKKALQDVRDLVKKVDGLVNIFCGENFSKWNEGYTHAVVVIAKTRKALDAYRKHPDHQDVALRIERMEAKSLGVDFES